MDGSLLHQPVPCQFMMRGVEQQTMNPRVHEENVIQEDLRYVSKARMNAIDAYGRVHTVTSAFFLMP